MFEEVDEPDFLTAGVVGRRRRAVGRRSKIGGAVIKIDEDRRLVWGWASVIEEGGEPVVDKQGDVIDENTLVGAAHAFVSDCRRAKMMHAGDQVGDLVESAVLTKDVQDALGVDLGRVGWWVCFKIRDDDAWQLVKDGNLRAFSIGGSGTREPVGEEE